MLRISIEKQCHFYLFYFSVESPAIKEHNPVPHATCEEDRADGMSSKIFHKIIINNLMGSLVLFINKINLLLHILNQHISYMAKSNTPKPQ